MSLSKYCCPFLGAAAFQQGIPGQKPADHVSSEDIAASYQSHEPSLRPFQNIQGSKPDEVCPQNETDARGVCLPGYSLID